MSLETVKKSWVAKLNVSFRFHNLLKMSGCKKKLFRRDSPEW